MLHMRRRARVTAVVCYVRCKERCFDIVDQLFEVGDKQRTQSSAASGTDKRSNGVRTFHCMKHLMCCSLSPHIARWRQLSWLFRVHMYCSEDSG